MIVRKYASTSASEPVRTAGKQPAAPERPEKSVVAAAGGVDIGGFPQILLTRTLGDPDTLFIPLLDAARESHKMIGRLTSRGENRANAVVLCGMHLAQYLLQDSSFSLVARGASLENAYFVDFESDALRVNTRLYATVSHRTSYFKVEIEGKISGGPVVVRGLMNNAVLMQVEEERVRQPNFLSTTLPQECLRAQMERERFGRVEEEGPQASNEIRLMTAINGISVPVVLRQKKGGEQWDIIDGRVQEWAGTLPLEIEQSLGQVILFIHQLLNKK
jgi:hypothetical protein